MALSHVLLPLLLLPGAGPPDVGRAGSVPTDLCGNGRRDTYEVPGPRVCAPCAAPRPGEPPRPCPCATPSMPMAEPCDGRDLGGRRCRDLGYAGGRLACNPDCTDFETRGCRWCVNRRGVRCLPSALPEGLAPGWPLLLGAASDWRLGLAWLTADRDSGRWVFATYSARGTRTRLGTPFGRVAWATAAGDLVGTPRGWLLASREGDETVVYAVDPKGEPAVSARIEGLARPTWLAADGRWLLLDAQPHQGAYAAAWFDAAGQRLEAPPIQTVVHRALRDVRVLAAQDEDALVVGWRGHGSATWMRLGADGPQSSSGPGGAVDLTLRGDTRLHMREARGGYMDEWQPSTGARRFEGRWPPPSWVGSVFGEGAKSPLWVRFGANGIAAALGVVSGRYQLYLASARAARRGAPGPEIP